MCPAKRFSPATLLEYGCPCLWPPTASATSIFSLHPSAYVLSDGRSIHNSIYFEAPAPAPGDTAHFEYTGRFVTSGKYATEADILANIKPYDTASAEYRKYTAVEAPHIIRLDSLAHAIVGNETNPYRQSEMVFDYIIDRYPWAGAREYSTIACIPQYVVDEGHGDCGQVSLLYISLMRSLGVPARWESGWMLHPGEVNLHDWTEVYFEGVGWLPVDGIVRPLHRLRRRREHRILLPRHRRAPSGRQQRRVRRFLSGQAIRAQRDRRLPGGRSRVRQGQRVLSGMELQP